MKLSITVMAHPSREKYFSYLNEKLDHPSFVIDTGRGLIANALKAWYLYNKDADWHIVVQDDAIICEDFIERAKKAIKDSNHVIEHNHLVNFYYDKMLTPDTWEEMDGIEYVVRSKLCWAVAVAMPVKMIPDFLTFWQFQRDPQDDERITKFLKWKCMKVFWPIPSLVDHRQDKSLVGNEEGRKAWRFIDNENTNKL